MIHAVAAVALLWAAPALAHGTLPNGGGFYAGLLHPFLASEHLLLLIGLGLLLGRQPRQPAQVPLAGLALALGAGLALTDAGDATTVAAAVILVGAVAAGGALAAAQPVPALVLTGIAAAAGLAIGFDTGVPAPMQGSGLGAVVPYAGVFVGVFLVTLNTMALASVAWRPPYTIALRVAGSWIVAAAVILLALIARGPGAAA